MKRKPKCKGVMARLDRAKQARDFAQGRFDRSTKNLVVAVKTYTNCTNRLRVEERRVEREIERLKTSREARRVARELSQSSEGPEEQGGIPDYGEGSDV